MIRIDCNFDSIILATKVNVRVYLPNKVDYMQQVENFRDRYTFAPFKTLYLLHGMWDSADQWTENTDIVRYAQNENIALVIPSVGNSFYVNTIYGSAYSDFFVQELMGFVRGMFPLSDKREDNFICGISMGGYGALRFSFLYSELFCKTVALSATPDISYAARFMKTLGVKPDYIIGNWKELKGSELDLKVMAASVAERKNELPDLLFICGNNDYLNHQAAEFKEYIDSLGIKNEYRVYHGSHDWDFWGDHVKEALEWLLGKEEK